MQREAARAIEAILMVADQPIDPHVLAQVLEVSEQDVVAMCDELMASYEVNDAGFVLQRIAGGYRFQSHPDLAAYVERFVLEGQSARLSAAAMETLAIVAYKQPVSRAQVASIRGVNVDGVMRTLQQRGLIEEISRDPGPGQAILFGTSAMFLERLGLDSLQDLPPLGQFVPGADVFEALERGLRPDTPEEAAAAAATEAEAGASPDSDVDDLGEDRYAPGRGDDLDDAPGDELEHDGDDGVATESTADTARTDESDESGDTGVAEVADAGDDRGDTEVAEVVDAGDDSDDSDGTDAGDAAAGADAAELGSHDEEPPGAEPDRA